MLLAREEEVDFEECEERDDGREGSSLPISRRQSMEERGNDGGVISLFQPFNEFSY